MFVLLTGNIEAGKTTQLKYFEGNGFDRLIEYTTRPKRKNEVNDVDYHFTTDEVFDRMEADGEFAETQCIKTVHGIWKYGARKADFTGNKIFAVGVRGAEQVLDAGIPALSVLLDINRDVALKRAMDRGDDPAEFNRRFDKDQPLLDKVRPRMSMVVNAALSQEAIYRAIDNRISLERMKEIRKSEG